MQGEVYVQQRFVSRERKGKKQNKKKKGEGPGVSKQPYVSLSVRERREWRGTILFAP